MDYDRLRREQQELLYQQIPLTRTMAMQFDAFDGTSLTLSADLEPNLNAHNAAFAGSLYSAGAVCAWSMILLHMRMHELEGPVVVAHAEIDYYKPITERIIARCEFPDYRAAFDQLRERGRVRIDLQADMHTARGLAAKFTGQYALRREST